MKTRGTAAAAVGRLLARRVAPSETPQQATGEGHDDRTSTRAQPIGSQVPRALEVGPRHLGLPRGGLLSGRMSLARLLARRKDRPRGAGRHLPDHRSGHPRPEPDGMPEGRRLEPAALQRGAGPASAQAGRGARRGQVGGNLLGPGAPRDRRRHPRRRRGPGRRVALPHRHPRRGGDAADHVERLLRAAGIPGDGSPGRDQRLQSRHLHHLREVRSRPGDGRLLQDRADPDLAREPGVHQHHLVSLRAGGALQRQRRRHHRAGLQPLGDPRRRPRPHRDRDRYGLRQRDVAGDSERGPGGSRFHPVADGPAAAGAHGRSASAARERSRRRRGGPVLLARHGLGRGRSRPQGDTRSGRCRVRARGIGPGALGKWC